MKRATPIFLCFVLGCVSDDLPKSYELGGLRVLAVIADQPEVDPGETVTLTPLLSDLGGDGRTIRFSADACLDPGVSVGAEPTCDGSPTRVVLATNQSATGLVDPERTGLLTSTVSVTVPDASVIFASRSAIDRFNGVGYLVAFRFTAGSDEVRASKKIVVSTRTTKNQNPAYASPGLFASDGSEVTSLPQESVDLFVKTNAGETYEEKDPSGATVTQTETIETFWYLSDGDLAQVITEDRTPTEFTPPDAIPGGRDVVIVTVTRDARGGQAATVTQY